MRVLTFLRAVLRGKNNKKESFATLFFVAGASCHIKRTIRIRIFTYCTKMINKIKQIDEIELHLQNNVEITK